MKYIETNFNSPTVIDYETELKLNELDEESLSDSAKHPCLGGSDVYDQVRSFDGFTALKQQMYEDQGGICCYCGSRLKYPNHPQYIVEHVIPKESNRQLAGEYKNLLLSCRPSEKEEDLRKAASRKEQKKFFHCDKSKGSTPITYTPLQKDCDSRFRYDEFGDVDVADKTDDCAIQDLRTLNLKCEWLKRRRKDAIAGELYDENNQLLPDDELRERLKTIMERNNEGMYAEFCFVVKDAITHILDGSE